MKTCSKCKIEKDFNEFHKFKNSKDGLKSQCKACILSKERERRLTEEYKVKSKQYNQSIPKEVKKEYKIKYYIKNKTKILDENKFWRDENQGKVKKYSKKYREENPDKIKEHKKKYVEKNPNKIKEYRVKYRDKSSEKNKIWRENNPDKVKEYRKKYSKSESYKEDRKNWHISFKKRSPHILAWRSILINSLKRMGKKKEDETIKLLGYSALELREYIESLFVEGMSWDNYGEWHIDHIKPVSSYEQDTPVDVVNSLENLQPLWAFDNLSKGNKI